MAFALESVRQFLGTPFVPKPFIQGWNRLEGRPRAESFERALRAEARDAMWFLARQWQFLELQADDAGSPIEARIAMRQTRLARYAPRDAAAGDFPSDLPLEAVVERETAPCDRVALIQVHRALDKALQRSGTALTGRLLVHAAMRVAYPLVAISDKNLSPERQHTATGRGENRI